MKIDHYINTDVLVIGGGVAATRAALSSAQNGAKTTMVIKKELGKYIFWMDINGHIKDQKLKNIFDQVKEMTSMLKILGSYPEATNII